MKKIFISIMLCTIALVSYGQNYPGYEFPDPKVGYPVGHLGIVASGYYNLTDPEFVLECQFDRRISQFNLPFAQISITNRPNGGHKLRVVISRDDFHNFLSKSVPNQYYYDLMIYFTDKSWQLPGVIRLTFPRQN